MKNQMIAIAGAAVMTIAGIVGVATLDRAEAQKDGTAPVILTVRMQQVLSQSKAGQTIPDQAQSVTNDVIKELETEVEKLKNDIENYQKNASLMSEEVRQQTEQELTIRQQVGLPQRQQIADRALTQAVQTAQNKILVASQPIIKDIIDRRGATVVLDASTVVYAAVDTDITQEVISELDKELDSVEVQRFTLAEIEQQLREQAAAQQAAQQDN